MVLPTRETSEASLSSVEEMLEMAFGDPDANRVDFSMFHALLLLLARSLNVLERQVLVQLESASSSYSSMSIREMKITAKKKAKEHEIHKKHKHEKSHHKHEKTKEGKDGELSESDEDVTQKGTSSRKKHAGHDKVRHHHRGEAGHHEDEGSYEESGASTVYGGPKTKRGKGGHRAEMEAGFDEEYSDENVGGAGRKRHLRQTPSETLIPESEGDGGRGGKGRKGKHEEDTFIEKLIVVEMGADGQKGARRGMGSDGVQSIATKEDFNNLLAQVMEIKKRFSPISIPGFEMLEKMYHNAYDISDSMAIMQLSTRLQYTERALCDMTNLLQDLANKQPGKKGGAKGGAPQGGQFIGPDSTQGQQYAGPVGPQGQQYAGPGGPQGGQLAGPGGSQGPQFSGSQSQPFAGPSGPNGGQFTGTGGPQGGQFAESGGPEGGKQFGGPDGSQSEQFARTGGIQSGQYAVPGSPQGGQYTGPGGSQGGQQFAGRDGPQVGKAFFGPGGPQDGQYFGPGGPQGRQQLAGPDGPLGGTQGQQFAGPGGPQVGQQFSGPVGAQGAQKFNKPDAGVIDPELLEIEELEEVRSETTDTFEFDDRIDPKSIVTQQEFRLRFQHAKNTLPKMCIAPSKLTQFTAATALKSALEINIKMVKALDVGTRMDILEQTSRNYASCISEIDVKFSTTVTGYQEEITDMEQTLEIAIDTMCEAIANRKSDIEPINELNNHFNKLEADLCDTNAIQRELDRDQDELDDKLKTLFEEIKSLQLVKSTRAEVEDALSTKAGVYELNGKITKVQIMAEIGKLEKRIKQAYDVINSQENTWQRLIDDLFRDCNEKAEIFQVESYRLDLLEKAQMLKERLLFMLEIAGEFRRSDDTRGRIRDQICISCGTLPPHMEPPIKTRAASQESQSASGEPGSESVLERPVKEVCEKKVVAKTIDDGGGDGDICYPGLPIPHPYQPSDKICKRYRVCGEKSALQRGDDYDIAAAIRVKYLQKPSKTPRLPRKLPCIPCAPPPERRRRARARKRTTVAAGPKSEEQFEVVEEELAEEEFPEEEEEEDKTDLEYYKFSLYRLRKHHDHYEFNEVEKDHEHDEVVKQDEPKPFSPSQSKHN